MTYDSSDNLLMRFEYADSRMPMAMTSGGAVYYLAYDQVGSLRVVADALGNIVKSIEYDSFGNVITDSNPAFVMPFGFAGGLHDKDTGLVRFGVRDYDPDVGRWTAKDPILFAGGDTDLYGYCLSDSVNGIDPSGLAEKLTWGTALSHYLLGGGQPLNVPISDVYPKTGLTPSDFSGPNNTRVVDTNGPSGNVTFHLSNGQIGVYNDRFDFDPKPWGVRDPNGFPYIKEVSTRIGASLPGNPYDIIFEGKILINQGSGSRCTR